MVPLDLGAKGTCTIGGNAATNAGGWWMVDQSDEIVSSVSLLINNKSWSQINKYSLCSKSNANSESEAKEIHNILYYHSSNVGWSFIQKFCKTIEYNGSRSLWCLIFLLPPFYQKPVRLPARLQVAFVIYVMAPWGATSWELRLYWLMGRQGLTISYWRPSRELCDVTIGLRTKEGKSRPAMWSMENFILNLLRCCELFVQAG